MEIRLIFILALLLRLFTTSAQKELLIFELSKPSDNVSVTLSDSLLKNYTDNFCEIKYAGSDVIHHIQVLNGSVSLISKGFYKLNFTKEGTSYIKIFFRNDDLIYNGFTKEIKVVGLPVPNIAICNVTKDSALYITQLQNNFQITAQLDEFSSYKLPVVGYTVNLNNRDYQISGDEIPLSLKKYLLEYREGDEFMITDVKVYLPDPYNQIVIVPRLSVFLIEKRFKLVND